jgi:hypothetical protein
MLISQMAVTLAGEPKVHYLKLRQTRKVNRTPQQGQRFQDQESFDPNNDVDAVHMKGRFGFGLKQISEPKSIPSSLIPAHESNIGGGTDPSNLEPLERNHIRLLSSPWNQGGWL